MRTTLASYPKQIEDAVALHPGVAEVAAVGEPDARSGELVRIVVVNKAPALTEEVWLRHRRQYLTDDKLPTVVEFREEPLPKSSIGKILCRCRRAAETPAQQG